MQLWISPHAVHDFAAANLKAQKASRRCKFEIVLSNADRLIVHEPALSLQKNICKRRHHRCGSKASCTSFRAFHFLNVRHLCCLLLRSSVRACTSTINLE